MIRNKLLLSLLFFFTLAIADAQTWIWYPGDFEITLANQIQNRRTERGTFFPVFWKMDNHYVLVDFHRDYDLKTAERINIAVEGKYNVKLDGKAFEGSPSSVLIPAGKHRINIKVFNQATVPAVFVKGTSIVSDASWLVTFEDKEWIDETGKTSDISATKWLNAGSWNFNSADQKPSQFKLPVKPQQAVSIQKSKNTWLVDFGKETLGFIQLKGIKGNGRVSIYYGESKEEALSKDHGEALDRVDINSSKPYIHTLELSKAFRYVQLEIPAGVSLQDVGMLYEYADVKERGSFRCNDSLINNIYEVAKYTFHLNTREFFIDGIKRDRWVWSGDAYQSYLMNYYLFFDKPTVERTLMALRGKDPVTAHINTIMDYTFYWFLGIYDYYLYTGDANFIKTFYPQMQSLMEYCLGRRNQNGLMQGLPGDWIFIDWATGLSKKGEVSFEQLLLCRALETMNLCAGIMNDDEGRKRYAGLASELRSKIFNIYWNPEKQALVHSRVEGRQTENVTRYSNMFSIFFDYFNESQKEAVKKSVLLNNQVQKITTPYMRFYELEALCATGEQNYVLKEMKDYWGGMLKLGATSFWEEYDPAKSGTQHLAMYGREFGKSLCHAWGASPIYLLGKYYLGVKPTSPGYSTYEVKPVLGGLEWMEGKVPTPNGEIDLHCTKQLVKIIATEGKGTLLLHSSKMPTGKGISVKEIAAGYYSFELQPRTAYEISYEAL